MDDLPPALVVVYSCTCHTVGVDTINRNYPIRVDQAEWLREEAFRKRRKQAEIVRDALDLYRQTTEAPPSEVTPARRLVERFVTGDGVDLDILIDHDRRIYGIER